jgi:hypothetical protein
MDSHILHATCSALLIIYDLIQLIIFVLETALVISLEVPKMMGHHYVIPVLIFEQSQAF